MADFTNDFSWSKSRDNLFKECARKYYFRYYGSWGGWEFNAPERVRQIYILKQLKSRYIWIGQVVHSCIERSIKNISKGIRPINIEEIIKITERMMRADFASSKSRRYLKIPKTCALFEHEYNIDVGEDEWEKVYAYVEECLRNFYGSELYQELYSCSLPKENWLEIEEFSSFWLDYVKVYVSLDFAYKHEQDIVIYDWKTGRSEKLEKDNIQLACYALYAMEKWKVPTTNIKTAEYNLGRNEIHKFPVDSAVIEGVKEYIRGSIRDMKELLRDKVLNEAVEEDFVKTIDENRCSKCNFQKVCLT